MTSFDITQQYRWECCDILKKTIVCTSFEFTILGYTWEQGKDDPGSPQITNTVDLVLLPEIDFILWNRMTYACDKQTKLKFIPPGNPQNAQRVFAVSGNCR